MRRVLALGGIAAAVVAAVLIATSGSASHPYRVRAEFVDAEGLRPGYDVKIDGVRAGQVESVNVTANDKAVVTLDLERSGAPVGAGAQAEVRPVNLLGEKYVDLHRGNLRRPQRSGTLIPISRTSADVELDEVLDALQPDTRAALRVLINEAGIALAGRGVDFNAVLYCLPRSLSSTHSVIAQLAAENRQLGTLIDEASVAVGPTAQHSQDVTRFIGDTRNLLSTVAQHRRDLASTIQTAPPLLAQFTTTLDSLNATAARLVPVAQLLGQTAPFLTGTLQQLPSFAAAARSPLLTARRVAPTLQRLGVSGTPVVVRLQPTLQLVDRFANLAQPLVYTLGRAGGVDGILGVMNNWGQATTHRDSLSHYFNLRLIITQRFLTSAVDRLLALQPRAARSARPNAVRVSPIQRRSTELPPSRTPASKRSASSSSTPPATKRPPSSSPPPSPAPLSTVLPQFEGLIKYLLTR